MITPINDLISQSSKPNPSVGDAATICYWSDRVAATVVKVSPSGKTVTVVEDISTVVSGSCHDGSADYTYAPGNPAHAKTFRLNSRGRFQAPGGGGYLTVGRRDTYRDPSF